MSRRTLWRTIEGWLAGCLMATAALDIFILLLVTLAGARRMVVLSLADFILTVLVGVPVILLVVCMFTAIPAFFAIWLSERFHLRSLKLYACGGAAVGALVGLLFKGILVSSIFFAIAGCPAGMVYWLVAGRHAGDEDNLVPKSPTF